MAGWFRAIQNAALARAHQGDTGFIQRAGKPCARARGCVQKRLRPGAFVAFRLRRVRAKIDPLRL